MTRSMAGIDGIVGAGQQLIQVAGKMHANWVFADGGQIGCGLPVQQAELLQIGPVQRFQTVRRLRSSKRSSLVQCGLALSPTSEWRSQVDSVDQLSIDTPEQIALELPLAGIGSRFLALGIDTLLQSILYVLGGIGFVLLPAGASGLRFSMSVGAALAVLFFFCVYWGYFAFFEVVWRDRLRESAMSVFG